jgi:hypothetical protein
LVLEVSAGSTSGYSVRIAYGTKSLDKDTRGKIDVIIETAADINACGIAVPTRFDLENTAVIPWDPPDCGCWHGRYTPVLGALPIEKQTDCAWKLHTIRQKQAAASAFRGRGA